MDKRRAELENEYRQAIYAVFSEEKEIIFRVGKIPQALDELLRKYNSTNFAFITAYNPLSKVLSDSENEARQNDLKNNLRAENFKFLEGYGADEKEVWRCEKSVFIFNVLFEKAVKIGKNYKQNAILYGEKNGEIRLVWCYEN